MILDPSKLLLFLTASWVLIITPGPDMIYVITRGASHGKSAGIISAVGVTAGLFVHTIFAVFGISVVLKASAVAFTLLKTAGAVYLVIIGIKTIVNREVFELKKNNRSQSRLSLFTQGVFSNIFNPKVALFFLAFLPQFVDVSRRHGSIQMLLLGLIFSICGLTFLICVGYFAGGLAIFLFKKPVVSRAMRFFSGGVLIVLGIRLAFSASPKD